MSAPAIADGPLTGIRVVDLTRVLSGPYCTMLLGDQGADVLKIEPVGRGDSTRYQANPMIGDENSAFLAVNRNKRSVVINLRDARGIELVRRLAVRADVIVENFRPGTADEMGLGWPELRELNPGLVYCSISGWGSDGPYAQRAGYAMTAEALGGLMSVTGEQDRPPVKIGVSLLDNLAGLFAKDAITAALLARTRTGRGQKVEASLLESTIATLSMTAYAYLLGGVVGARTGSEHAFVVPWKAFESADGYLVLAGGKDDQFRRLCRVLGHPELAADARFDSAVGRGVHREELYGILNGCFLRRSTADWLSVLAQAGLAAAPVNTVDQVFSDPQVVHREMVQHVPHPTLGSLPQVGHAQKLSGTPARIRLAPPLLGQHTDEVLRDYAGCDEAELTALHIAGVIA